MGNFKATYIHLKYEYWPIVSNVIYTHSLKSQAGTDVLRTEKVNTFMFK